MASTNLPTNLKKAREEKGYTQEYVASQCGVTQAMYSYYEKGFKQPSIDVLERLANVFEKTIDELLTA